MKRIISLPILLTVLLISCDSPIANRNESTSRNQPDVTTGSLSQDHEPFSVNITGPNSIPVGSSGTFVANIEGGTAPYNYTWSYKELHGSWIYVAYDSAYTHYATEQGSYLIRVEVTDHIDEYVYDTDSFTSM